ncbi:unnamed protein product [Adineta ricciae]|uniref:Uncharacterized protein n=1 Tax=Adineta ricciae TaxID=249248 RepID=A0A813Y1G8_ADIRI|nr:unnamed protein product [Adineta ricciae]
MTLITNGFAKQIDAQASKSNSTIQLKFSESFLQLLATTYDSNSNTYPSYSSRKRCASTISEKTISNENKSTNKKQRTLFEGIPIRGCDLSTNEVQQQNSRIMFQLLSFLFNVMLDIMPQRSVSIPNATDNNFEWLKDFMRQSLDTIRDAVVQACITAISSQSMQQYNSRISTRDINVNNHLMHFNHNDHEYYIQSTARDNNNFMSVQNIADNEDNRKVRIHHRARSNPYPMYRSLMRTPVSDIQVPWSFEWSDYRPIIFTAQEVGRNSSADPDLLNSSLVVSLRFNTIDGVIDRRSVYQYYQLDAQSGLPLNPVGRTGIQGRGILLRWGPNVYQYIMICRWKRDAHGRLLVHPTSGKNLLEILLEIQADDYETTDLILTGGLRVFGSHLPPQLQDRLGRFLIHADMIRNRQTKMSSSFYSLNQLFQHEPVPWKGAYLDDARNTDNAWIELAIGYILDDDENHRLTSCIPSLHEEQLRHLLRPRFVWKDVQNTSDVGPRTHSRLIRSLAHKLDAHF